MTTSGQMPSAQLGLLDLSVDLSVPEVYSGTDFTVYLHVKNPFAVPAWIDSVELSLPTQLLHRSAAPTKHRKLGLKVPRDKELRRKIAECTKRIGELRATLKDFPDTEAPEHNRIQEQINDLNEDKDRLFRELASEVNIVARQNAVINLDGQWKNANVTALNSSTVNLRLSGDEEERLQLTGSLPKGAALEPGCTDVWTIRLGTRRSPFFIPAKYHLQLTVVYALEPPSVYEPAVAGMDDRSLEGSRRRIFSNTTALSVPVKAALWNVMLGGIIGGMVGSAGRSLQNAKALDLLVSERLGAAVASLILSTILSWAAIIFSARKSEAQSFVTVEDFWGGLLIGFLIGYSGTAAFTSITGVKT